MKTATYELKVTKAKTEGKTQAYVKIKAGPFWVTYTLDKSNGKFFLNPPSKFVDSLKGTTTQNGKHSGWIESSGLSKDVAQEIKAQALEELGLKEAAA